MGNIRMIFEPAVIEIVGWFCARGDITIGGSILAVVLLLAEEDKSTDKGGNYKYSYYTENDNRLFVRCFHVYIISRYQGLKCYNRGIMPELPEVETVRRGLKPFILNKKIVHVKVDCEKSMVGGSEMAQAVEGAMVIDLRRRGKALLIDLDNGCTMMIHLRMTGQLIWRGDGAENFAAGHPSKNFTDELPNKQTRVTFIFETGKLFFNDQRKFGFVKILATPEVEMDKFIMELAKEPWDMTSEELYDKCQRHGRSPIKAVLLNQKIIAGLGNIYADESLFYAGVHPETYAGLLEKEQVAKILEGACKVMQAAIDSGGSTMATYVRPDGTTGDYLEKFARVFRRDGKECYRCGAEIIKLRVAGRGTHICPECQQRVELPSKMPGEGSRRA